MNVDSKVVEKLLESLKWYIENDDTNNYPQNKFWLDGKHQAEKVVAEVESLLTKGK